MRSTVNRGVDIDFQPKPGFDAVSWLTIYVALLFLIPSNLVFGPLGSAGAPSMLFGLVSLLVWLLFRAGATRSSPAGAHPIRIALFVFLFSVGVSFAIAMSRPIDVDEISPADVALLAVASWAGTMLTAHDGIMSRRRLDVLIWRVVVCGGLVAALGIFQVLTRQAWVNLISIPGLTATDVLGTYTRGAYPRPSGTAIHPIEFGVVVTMLLPLALHVAIHHTERNRIVRWLPALALAIVVPISSSRSAYVGAVLGLLIILFGWPRKVRLRLGLLGVVGALAMIAITPNLLNSILSLFTGAGTDPSIASRTGSFDLAFEFISRNPLFGRGLGTFLPKYRIFDNQYLGLLVSIGIVGTLAFLSLAIAAIVVLLRLRKRLSSPRNRDLALSLVAAVSVGFVCLVMFDAFSFPMTMGALFLILGVAGALRRLESPSFTTEHLYDGYRVR